MGEVGDRRVVREEARRGGVRVAGVVGQDQVTGQAQVPGVAPPAGVVLLVVVEQDVGVDSGIGPARNIGDVGYPLLLVDDQVFDDVEVFRLRLKAEGAGSAR